MRVRLCAANPHAAGSLAGGVTRLRLLLLPLALLAALALAACGSSGGSAGDAKSLVKETFGSGAKVHSGNISLLASIEPQGLVGLAGPVQLRFGGPFDKPAQGNAPRFAFTFAGSAAGRSFAAGILSTGAAGFVSLSGKNYSLPPAQFAAFKKSFSSVQSLAQPRTSGSGEVSWLVDPKLAGDSDVGGVATKHVSAGIDVAKLLDSIEHRGGGAQRLTAGQRQGVVDAVKDGRFDFYTGAHDHILRRVRIAFRLDVPAARRSQFGGLSSAGVTLDYTIAQVNQPQTITAPKVTGTQAELNRKLQGILSGLSALSALANGGGASGSGSSGPSGSGSSGSGSGSGSSGGGGSAALQRYQACLANAAGDSAAVQKCQALLQGP